MLEVCCEPIYGQFNVTSVLRVKYFTYCGTVRFTHGGVGNAQFTPPTPTRRNCRVSLRRRSRCKLSRRRSAGILNSSNNRTFNKVSPRGRRDDISPADGSSTVAYRFAANQAISIPTCTLKSRRIYVRPRTGPQSAHLWWPAMAKMQAASVPIA